ncbi:MAG: hypothetical protein ACKOWF_08985 [Chloroflexota bacterium]
MAHPPHVPMQRRDRLQMWLFIAALLLVVIGAIVVVSYPRQFGLPGRHAATPAAVSATPAAP